ncbi:hypothetical protein ACFL43_04115 [Thermodesulfobacteriota bacterium]
MKTKSENSPQTWQLANRKKAQHLFNAKERIDVINNNPFKHGTLTIDPDLEEETKSLHMKTQNLRSEISKAVLLNN